MSLDDADNLEKAYVDANAAKTQALYGMIGTGTSAAIIWILNVRDIKKNFSNSASTTQPVSVGLNPAGQVQFKISF